MQPGGWVLGLGLPLGWWACTVTARNMGRMDPGNIVWDEVIAFWLVLWLVSPTSLAGQAMAFGLFRYFDAAKPGPVGWADDSIGGGLGVMVDDILAAGYGLIGMIALGLVWR